MNLTKQGEEFGESLPLDQLRSRALDSGFAWKVGGRPSQDDWINAAAQNVTGNHYIPGLPLLTDTQMTERDSVYLRSGCKLLVNPLNSF